MGEERRLATGGKCMDRPAVVECDERGEDECIVDCVWVEDTLSPTAAPSASSTDDTTRGPTNAGNTYQPTQAPTPAAPTAPTTGFPTSPPTDSRVAAVLDRLDGSLDAADPVLKTHWDSIKDSSALKLRFLQVDFEIEAEQGQVFRRDGIIARVALIVVASATDAFEFFAKFSTLLRCEVAHVG